jgi:2-polyprenyl-3-methyl-5-hydroxy-6-metoxy-1,4-benzoquinol methylase
MLDVPACPDGVGPRRTIERLWSLHATILMTSELLAVVACPECGGDLLAVGSCLRCSGCGFQYALSEQGIPLLYPRDLDRVHLDQEERLAKMMIRSAESMQAKAEAEEWRRSKVDFWRLVMQRLSAPPKRIIYLGCGYDVSFRQFQELGYTFVNCDLVSTMLHTLKTNFGASHCVAGDISKPPFKKQTFDYVVVIDVLHHQERKVHEVLGRITPLLKPGGTIFLQEPNAWGLFQFWKSILLPKPVYRLLRHHWHTLRKCNHHPADYEFAMTIGSVKRALQRLGVCSLEVHEHSSYPCVSRMCLTLWRTVMVSRYVRTFHNYHWTISGTMSRDTVLG